MCDDFLQYKLALIEYFCSFTLSNYNDIYFYFLLCITSNLTNSAFDKITQIAIDVNVEL